MSKRIMRLREVNSFDLEYMTLKQLSDSLPDWIERYGPAAFLEVTREYDTNSIALMYESEETDAEFERRMNYEKSKHDREKAEYLRLKEKFEGEAD